jgi:hypothetical protein
MCPPVAEDRDQGANPAADPDHQQKPEHRPAKGRVLYRQPESQCDSGKPEDTKDH